MTLASALSISDQAGNVVVDMTKMDPDFSLSLNNPLIDFATPTADVAYNAAPSFNVYTINIGFLTNGITITLKEMGGLGSLLNSTRTTVFEKMFWLAFFDKKYKKFYLNDTNYIPVAITSYRAHVAKGQKDIVEHNIGLMITNSESE